MKRSVRNFRVVLFSCLQAKHSFEVYFLSVQTELMIFQTKRVPSTLYLSKCQELVLDKNLDAIFSPFISANRILFAVPQKILSIPGLPTFSATSVVQAASTSHLDYWITLLNWFLPSSLPLFQEPLFSAAAPVSF